MTKLEVLSHDEILKIHEASMNVLYNIGIIIKSDKALKLLEGAGATVDYKRNLVRIPEYLLKEALTHAPSNIVVYDRDRKNTLNLGDDNTYAWSGYCATYILTLDLCERRMATLDDLAKFTRLADALENIHVVGMQVVPQDVPYKYADVKAAQIMFNNTSKHIFLRQSDPTVTRIQFKLAQTILGENELIRYPIMTSLVDPTTPLVWGREAAEILMENSRFGTPCIIASCPVSGGTTPITLAGTLVIQNAEILSGILIAQLIRKRAPVIYGGAPVILDPYEGTAVIGTPETVILRIAMVQLGKFYNLPTQSIGPDSDSHCLDEQNAWEKIITAAATINSRANIVLNSGMFASGLTASYEQLVIDNEILGYLFQLNKEIEVSPETLALEQIKKVGPGGSFLGIDLNYSLKHLKTEYWIPKISCRMSYRKWSEKIGKEITKIAKEKVNEILQTHQPAELQPEIQERLTQIVKTYERTLCST
ncbi:MAG: trimethylamine methyltransferase family protein [Candidatus Bathyarchaeia archaeon]